MIARGVGTTTTLADPENPHYIAGMCMICIDLAKQAMTASEARRALREMRGAIDKAHLAEVETKVETAEAEHEAATRP